MRRGGGGGLPGGGGWRRGPPGRTRNGSAARLKNFSGMECGFTPETFTNAHRRVLAKPWVKPPFGPPFIALTDYKTLLFAYPNDRRLDGLRILDREDTLREFLCNHLPEERWPSADKKLATTVVRYKPENRAVLRCEAESLPQSSDAAVYLRVYPSKRSATAMHSMMSDLLGWLGLKLNSAFLSRSHPIETRTFFSWTPYQAVS